MWCCTNYSQLSDGNYWDWHKMSVLMDRCNSWGAFHLSELTGQPIPIVMRISFLIKTNHPDLSNPKYYAQRRWFFSKTSWKKPVSLSCDAIFLPSHKILIQVTEVELYSIEILFAGEKITFARQSL